MTCLTAFGNSAETLAAQVAHVHGQLDRGQHDFDFYVGKWRLHNRRLMHPLTGSKEWVEFDGTSVARKLWDGRANVDEFEADSPSGHIEGMSVRLYNADSHEWSIYWAASSGTNRIANCVLEHNRSYDLQLFAGSGRITGLTIVENTIVKANWL